MVRIALAIAALALLAGCTTAGQPDTQAQKIAEDFCQREGGEVKARDEGGTTRQYCHLTEGRVIEVHQFYRAGGLSID
ncbi:MULTISPECIES: DUF333 domain-containing protein [unclassified Halomonas]|uniref:DUF333 domain-containing protein n=1 Tax=unclassified Halomonas TaxID=2609666 RepID=UPI00209CAC5D|nr:MULTISPECIES: DUF333 domain-containing protein [unclassified Halomonas]MCP1315338.1 DUF333 domain-containing protein [Halomonas sp. 707D7]MCP1326562.1 DUF333 domain-containing protein [Halomonas sp. 707D4]